MNWKRAVSEADTVTVINDMLSDVYGYDKYLHVTSQYAIRGTLVDLPLKVFSSRSKQSELTQGCTCQASSRLCCQRGH
jgi:hypothetical protein